MTQSTLKRITKQAQRIARLENKLARQKASNRRLDTRQKILYGGLVIKAKLDKLLPEVLFNGLLDITAQLAAEPTLLDVFQAKGEAVFLEYLSVGPLNIPDYLKRQDDPLKAEVNLSSMMQLSEDLKKATRQKIQLGGLIIKAKLIELSKAQLLGALVALSENLSRKYLSTNKVII